MSLAGCAFVFDLPGLEEKAVIAPTENKPNSRSKKDYQ